jgi:hypothetical protein
MGPAADPFRVGPYLTGLASGVSLARPCCLGEDLLCSMPTTIQNSGRHAWNDA